MTGQKRTMTDRERKISDREENADRKIKKK